MVDKILDQKISIITGGARGIGKAISESLAK
jgi:NAD(P)-dependent dehydrogenase (short-subunit alcohol dehydrogenase family)